MNLIKPLNKINNDTPVIILSGGLGSRLSEETKLTPKPLVNLGNHSMIFHIMQIYMKNGFNYFIITTGYKHSNFVNYFEKILPKKLKEKIKIVKKNQIVEIIFKNFKVLLVFTGVKTLTANRIQKCKNLINKKKYFMVSYADSLLNVKIKESFKLLKKTNKIGIMTTVNPNERFGTLNIKNNLVINFKEKKINKNIWINCGFFIFKSEFLAYIKEKSMLERGPLYKLTKKKLLMAFKHKGFFHFVDTLKEKNEAISMIKKSKIPPWLK